MKQKTKNRISSGDLINQIIYTNHILQSENDLSPNNEIITETLGSFVSNIMSTEQYFSDTEKKQVLNNPEVIASKPSLLQGLSQAEYEMELFFSDKFLANKEQKIDLKEFWYLQNYIDLVDLELKNISIKKSNKEVVFIGSGPLPLTAIMIGQKTGAKITCLDLDESAIVKGYELANKLGMGNQIQFKQYSGEEYNYKDTAVVMIASLVNGKENVLNRITKTAPNDIQIAMRSAEGLHKILYEDVKPSILDEFNMCVQKVAKRQEKVINTTLICGFKHR